MKTGPILLLVLLLGGFAVYLPNSTRSLNPQTLVASGQAIPISSCQVLNTPGATYTLTANATGSPVPFPPGSLTCFLISSNGITFDLNGFNINPRNDASGIVVNASSDVISGPGTISPLLPFGTAIALVNGSDDTVRDVTMGLGFVGIRVDNSPNDLIEDNTITSVVVMGIDVTNSPGTRIVGNNITVGSLIVSPGRVTGILFSNSPNSLALGNTVEGTGNALVLDASSSHTLVIGNNLSSNLGSGLVSLSNSNIILGNVADGNSANGISLAGSSNLVAFNRADNNRLRGIGLGNVCSDSQVSFPSGDNNLIVLNSAGGTFPNSTIAEFPAFFWDGQGKGNMWLFDSSGGQPVPVTPPAGYTEC